MFGYKHYLGIRKGNLGINISGDGIFHNSLGKVITDEKYGGGFFLFYLKKQKNNKKYVVGKKINNILGGRWEGSV